MAVTPFQAKILRLLSAAVERGDVVFHEFHEGRICGAWPQIVEK